MSSTDDLLADLASRKSEGAHSPFAQKTVDRFVERVRIQNARIGRTDLKTLQVTHFRDSPLTFVVVEFGRPNDEGTLAAIFARDYRHVTIGGRGGLTLNNAKAKSKSRGWFNAVHGLTS